MGNSWFCDKKPIFDQPKLFDKFPEPDPISEIRPTLTFFQSKDTLGVEVNHTQNAQEAIEYISQNGLFSDSDQQQYRLVVVTHGFRSDKDSDWLRDAKDVILGIDTSANQQQQVVAILGWGGGADIGLFNYAQAASNCLETGRWLGSMIKEFRRKFPTVKTYGIGHSLGAHLMGMAGRCSDSSMDRITGLDPAGPGFQTANEDKRLNRNDAEMVDVIHTDGQDVPYYGTLLPLGKIDFYPNYGWDQPSNDGKVDAKPMIDRDPNHRKAPIPSQYGGFISESHGRAIDFFAWSILNPGKFRTHLKLENEPGVESASHRIQATPLELDIEVEMGYHLDSYILNKIKQHCDATKLEPRADIASQRFLQYLGNYYVHTNGKAPWC